MSTLICTCFEVRKTKATGRKQRMHGRMTLRGSIGTAGFVRYKCRNSRCGRTAHIRATAIPKMPEKDSEISAD